jgi:hypothetical protein
MQLIIITAIICFTIIIIAALRFWNEKSFTPKVVKKINLRDCTNEKAILRYDNFNLLQYSNGTFKLEYYNDDYDYGYDCG